MRARAALVATLFAFSLAPTAARANGRFPFAQHVIVGPDAGSAQIVLRATFGLLWSRDGGRTFDWMCEESIGFMGNWDPPVVFGTGGIVTGLPDGLSSTTDGCDFARASTIPTTSMIDLAASRDGTTIYGVENIPVVANRVFASVDGGRSWSVRGAGPADVSFDTVELAPSNAQRVYLSGLDGTTRVPVFLRSNDGAATMMRLPLPAESLMGATGAYVSGVASDDPDTLYVRVDRDGGTHLIRSRDGGQSWTIVLRANGELRGFAIADDGRIWTGGAMDPLQRSDDGGDHWTRVATPNPVCLRHHDGALYVCVDWVREPYALGRLRDGADAIEPILRFEDARGAVACGRESSAQTLCAPRWTAQRMLVTTRPIADAGADSAVGPMDASGGAMDASADAMDASADGSVTPPRPGGCACAVPAKSLVDRRWSALALLAASAALVRRRRSV